MDGGSGSSQSLGELVQATMANWGANLLVTLTFVTLINRLGTSSTFWVYTLVCLAAPLFTYLLVPETKGHSLEQIQAGKPEDVASMVAFLASSDADSVWNHLFCRWWAAVELS